jgi:hypothetical protein
MFNFLVILMHSAAKGFCFISTISGGFLLTYHPHQCAWHSHLLDVAEGISKPSVSGKCSLGV